MIEDDPKTVRALARGLRGEGFEPVTAKTGEEGFFLVSRESFDVVILDWMLPGRDGIEVLRTLRASRSKTPVLLLTAREVWREPNRATPLDNVIDVHLAHLRRKLDDGESVKLIQTVRGVGLVLRTEPGG